MNFNKNISQYCIDNKHTSKIQSKFLAHVSSNNSAPCFNETNKQESNIRFNILGKFGRNIPAENTLQYSFGEVSQAEKKRNIKKLWSSKMPSHKQFIVKIENNCILNKTEDYHNSSDKSTVVSVDIQDSIGYRALLFKNGSKLFSQDYSLKNNNNLTIWTNKSGHKQNSCINPHVSIIPINLNFKNNNKLTKNACFYSKTKRINSKISNLDKQIKNNKNHSRFVLEPTKINQNLKKFKPSLNKKHKNSFKNKKMCDKISKRRKQKNKNIYNASFSKNCKPSWKPKSNKNHPELMQKFRPQFIPLDPSLGHMQRVNLTFKKLDQLNLDINGIELAILYRKVKSVEAKRSILQKEQIKNIGKISVLNYIEILTKSKTLELKLLAIKTLSIYLKQELTIEQQVKVTSLLNTNIGNNQKDQKFD